MHCQIFFLSVGRKSQVVVVSLNLQCGWQLTSSQAEGKKSLCEILQMYRKGKNAIIETMCFLLLYTLLEPWYSVSERQNESAIQMCFIDHYFVFNSVQEYCREDVLFMKSKDTCITPRFEINKSFTV